MKAIRFLIVLAVAALPLLESRARAGGWIYATGYSSDNVVRFDLETGASEVVLSLAADARPRGVAVDEQGTVYVGLRGDTKNVKRLDLVTGALANLTASISGYGTGHIALDSHEDLIVAGDVSANLLRYDASSGALIDSVTLSGINNVVGMTVGGTYAYAADHFDDHILRYDLSGVPMTGNIFISGAAVPDYPLGMTVGHTGNLFLASSSQWIKEYGISTGDFVANFTDMEALGGNSRDLVYVPTIQTYFLPADDSVLAIGTNGQLLRTYQSDALSGAYGLAYVPEPAFASLFAMGLSVLLARRRRRRQ